MLSCVWSLDLFGVFLTVGLVRDSLSKNREYESCVKALANSMLDIQHKVLLFFVDTIFVHYITCFSYSHAIWRLCVDARGQHCPTR